MLLWDSDLSTNWLDEVWNSYSYTIMQSNPNLIHHNLIRPGIWLGYEKWKTLCHRRHTFKWISNRHILRNIFLVCLVSMCLERKLHTSFPPNQREFCEVHKDGGKKKEHSQIRKKFFFFFPFYIRREAEKDKKREA